MDTVTIPNCTSGQLIDSFAWWFSWRTRESTPFNRLRSWDFMEGQRGKTFEVLFLYPHEYKGRDRLDQIVEHFRKLGADGNAAAFITLVAMNVLNDYNVSVPRSSKGRFEENGVPVYFKYMGGSDLGVTPMQSCHYSQRARYIAFREIRKPVTGMNDLLQKYPSASRRST